MIMSSIIRFRTLDFPKPDLGNIEGVDAVIVVVVIIVIVIAAAAIVVAAAAFWVDVGRPPTI